MRSFIGPPVGDLPVPVVDVGLSGGAPMARSSKTQGSNPSTTLVSEGADLSGDSGGLMTPLKLWILHPYSPELLQYSLAYK